MALERYHEKRDFKKTPEPRGKAKPEKGFSPGISCAATATKKSRDGSCAHREGWVSLFSRKGLDWTERMAALAEAMSSIEVESAIIDGEVVVLDAEGVSDFQTLKNVLSEKNVENTLYCVFDLVHLDARDLSPLPLEKRKGLLGEVLGPKPDPHD